jgi:hypothetical protein
MKFAKSNESADITKSPEMSDGRNIHTLPRTKGPDEENNADMSDNGLGSLVRRVSEASHRQIGNLVSELQTLDNKLLNDGDRIQRDIEQYAELNQQVMQLTTIISDGVKRLPAAGEVAR